MSRTKTVSLDVIREILGDKAADKLETRKVSSKSLPSRQLEAAVLAVKGGEVGRSKIMPVLLAFARAKQKMFVKWAEPQIKGEPTKPKPKRTRTRSNKEKKAPDAAEK